MSGTAPGLVVPGMRCPVLRQRTAMRCPVLRERVSGTEMSLCTSYECRGQSSTMQRAGGLGGGAEEAEGGVRAISLRPCPRMLLAGCYAKSGTELAYAAVGGGVMRLPLLRGRMEVAICLRVCYAMSGTHIAYRGYLPTRLLRHDRY
eukprot:2585598-Rhodomonas_salina.3